MEPANLPLPADRHEFRYCPQCRAEMGRRLDGGSERPACPACGLVQYLNPAPADKDRDAHARNITTRARPCPAGDPPPAAGGVSRTPRR